MKLFSYLLILFAIFLDTAHAGVAADQHTSLKRCGDFLDELHLKQSGTEFIECKSVDSDVEFMRGVEALYHIKVEDIKKTEAWLEKMFDIKPMKYACCGWESEEKYFKASDKLVYSIRLAGVLEPGSDKKIHIPYFILSVTHRFEEP